MPLKRKWRELTSISLSLLCPVLDGISLASCYRFHNSFESRSGSGKGSAKGLVIFDVQFLLVPHLPQIAEAHSHTECRIECQIHWGSLFLAFGHRSYVELHIFWNICLGHTVWYIAFCDGFKGLQAYNWAISVLLGV